MSKSAPAAEEALYARLRALGIAWRTFEHEATFTVAQSAGLKAALPGAHTKNLFLKDKKGRLVLLSAHAETVVDLPALAKAMGAGRFSFGAPSLLLDTLGVQPGSVTAFALINAPPAGLAFVLDAALLAHEIVNFHPLRNDATTAIGAQDLLRFARALGHAPQVFAFSPDGAPRRIDGPWPADHLPERNSEIRGDT